MNDLPRHTLTRIIAEHGRGICDTPKRIESLLRDLCGAHRREINIIVGALEERVAADLIAAPKFVSGEALLARLAARLRDNLAYTPEAARWAVETWALALGVLAAAEIKERARREATNNTQNPSPSRTISAKPTPTQQPQPIHPPPTQPSPLQPPPSSPLFTSPPPQPQPKRAAPHAPPKTPTHAPAPQPPTFTQRAPTATPQSQRHTSPPNIIVAPIVPRNALPPPMLQPQIVEPQPPARRGVTLRGCLLSVVLLVVVIIAAVFVVPAVIMVLQEEQAQPSINEPRIR